MYTQPNIMLCYGIGLAEYGTASEECVSLGTLPGPQVLPPPPPPSVASDSLRCVNREAWGALVEQSCAQAPVEQNDYFPALTASATAASSYE